MRNIKARLMLAKDDYNIIMSYLTRGVQTITFNRQDAEELETELKKGKVVNTQELPGDVVRLNSKVTIR